MAFDPRSVRDRNAVGVEVDEVGEAGEGHGVGLGGMNPCLSAWKPCGLVVVVRRT